MNLGTWLFTRLKGRRVGADALGNVYYEERRPRPGHRLATLGRLCSARPRHPAFRRNGTPGCTTPPTHRWSERPRQPWEKPHLPNADRHTGQLPAAWPRLPGRHARRAPPATTKPGPQVAETDRMRRRNIAEVLTGAVVLLVAAGFLAYAVANSGRTASSGYHALCQVRTHRRARRRAPMCAWRA